MIFSSLHLMLIFAQQVLRQYITPDPVQMRSPASALDRDAITIGEALEATALSTRDKPVEQSDAAAIQAAEVRDTGRNVITPGGVAAMAQSAASVNVRIMDEEEKVKLSDVLMVCFFVFCPLSNLHFVGMWCV